MRKLLNIALLCLAGGCTTINELDKLDLASHLEKWLERAERTQENVIPANGNKKDAWDEIDLSSVVWYGPDIRGWAIASEFKDGVYVSGSSLKFPHTKAGQWKPNKDNLEGNIWAIVNYNGKWRGASWEWLRKNQTDKPWHKIENGHFKVGDLSGYQIKHGEEAYIIVAGLSRGAERNVPERTPAVRVKW